MSWGGRRRAVVAIVAVIAGLLTLLAGAAGARAADAYSLGDSVMLGAARQLHQRGFRVDAAESRQSYVAPRLVRSARALPRDVVVHLGTNGSFPLSTCRSLVRAAGAQRRVFLVTVHVPRSWQRTNNRTLRECAAGFPRGRVHVVDWHRAARRHSGWLYSDGIHLTPAGARGYAALIARAVARADATASGA